MTKADLVALITMGCLSAAVVGYIVFLDEPRVTTTDLYAAATFSAVVMAVAYGRFFARLISHKRASRRERRIRRTASRWYWKLKDPNQSAQERDAWQRWQAIPEHLAAFEKVSSDWDRWRQMPWPWRHSESAATAKMARQDPTDSAR